MAIELEMPADMEQIVEVEMEATTADQAVGLLEAETEPDVLDEGREIEGLDGETIPIANETIVQNDGESKQEKPAIWSDNTSANAPPGKIQLQTSQEVAQAAWKLQIRGISDELAEAALERLTAEATYKAAKAREKSVLERLAEVMHRGPQIMPLFDRQPGQQPSSQDVTAAESVAPDAQTWVESGGPVVIEPLTDEAWRSVHVSELRLKPKLQERLEEAGCETIGRLEDLRSEISQGREKWPKGIGKAKITEIEDAVIEWLSRNRDKQVLAEARAESQTPAAQCETEAFQEPGEFDPCARAVKLDDDELNPKHPDGTGCWESGRQAWSQDAQVSECPYVAGPEADDWIRGWLSAGRDNSQVQTASLDDL